jgi:hypothetical protein
MAVLTYREIVPRSFQHRFGESPTAEIRYHATTDGPTPTQTVLNTIGIFHGASHPEYGYLLCTEGNLNELDRFHVEVVYRYEVPATGTADSPEPAGSCRCVEFLDRRRGCSGSRVLRGQRERRCAGTCEYGRGFF